MLLTITCCTSPASDLGFLLHKHPDRVQDFSLSFGRAHVFYPEVSEEKTTAALLIEMDSVELVRRKGRGLVLNDYVNDRPYVASSFLSVALARVFGSALRGRLDSRPDLALKPLELQAHLPVVSSFDGEEGIRRLFEPLGYRVVVAGHALSERFPSWGPSPYFSLTLECTAPLATLLGHLYVLLPVLDGAKHYWVDDDEIDKLLRAGEGWLVTHPERDLITRRYLKGQRTLADRALGRLLAEDVGVVADEIDDPPVPLNQVRLNAVVEQLKRSGARRVLDLGCGEGRLIETLLKDPSISHVTGVDVSVRALKAAGRRLRIDEMTPRQRERVTLMQGALTYRDRRLAGFEAAALVEVIEHLDPWQLPSFERVVFGEAQPSTVVLTTPNAEYNASYDRLQDGSHRHADHRFEWTRSEFGEWASRVGEQFGYQVEFFGVGEAMEGIGTPTQMGVFRATASNGAPT